MKAKLIKEAMLDKDHQILPGVNNDDIVFNVPDDEETGEINVVIKSLNTQNVFDIYDILKNEYNGVHMIGGGRVKPGTNGIIIADENANIEDVSDLLFQYIAKGIVFSVDYV